MNEIAVSFGGRGRYSLQVLKDGKVKTDTGWFDNLITNTGLEMWGGDNADYIRWWHVGTGNTAPQFTDTTLQNRVASMDTNGTAWYSHTAASPYVYMTRTLAFGVGAVVGNITEVGVGPNNSGTSLFSRALVTDNVGNPISVTVLADEQLVMTYQFWVRIPIDDVTGTLGNGTTWVMRPAFSGTTRVYANAGGWTAGLCLYPQGSVAAQSWSYTLLIGALSAHTGGTTDAPGSTREPSSVSTPAKVAGTYTRTWSVLYGIGAGNFSPGTGITGAQTCCGAGIMQVSFNPPIMKTNLQTLKLNYRISWGRDTNPAPW